VYRYAHPVFLPEGTKITMRYSYDNSANNPFNPNRPPKLVEGGNRAADEMAHLWLQVLPHPERPLNEDPRMILQEALSRHEVEKDPANFEAQYNLAAMLGARHELPEAAQHYAAAARIRPHDAVVNNALGGMLLADGNLDEAIRHLQDAVQARPSYFDAHYNLALALASKNEFAGAAEQFRQALQIHPNDGNAHANFGSALAQLGQLSEAKTQFETALRMDPENKLARENLALVVQMLAGR
jgi:Tfp pilus assembly protein PilF